MTLIASMRRLLQIPLLILAMLLFGAIGLYLLTGEPFLKCFYWAFILLSTVGSAEPPLDSKTIIFVLVWLSCSLGVFAYSGFMFGQFLVNSDLRSILERRQMEKRIQRVSGHFIICGYGRMGQELCDYLYRRRQPFVVIDENVDVFTAEMREDQWMVIEGDATQDEVLKAAGIDRARALTTVLPTDADNLYVVLSARLLSKSLQIVARAGDDRAAAKMTQAGATRVINPLSSGAIRMARYMLSPSIENFVEVTESEGVDWEIADVQVTENSPLVGRKLKDTSLRDVGVMVLGVCRSSGEKHFPPNGDVQILAGDDMFAFGSAESLAQLAELVEGEAAS